MMVPLWLWLLFAGLLGATLGSFANVCIYRMPRECLSITRPRSRCPSCLRSIPWYENIPVLSFLALGGRCRGCGRPIGWRYPLVEVAMGILFAVAAWRLTGRQPVLDLRESLPVFLVQAYVLWALLTASVIDLDWRIIPDPITKGGMLVALAAAALVPTSHAQLFLLDYSVADVRGNAFLDCLLGMAAGGGVVFAAGVFGKVLFRKEAMGFGDVKYMAMLGGFLGVKSIVLVFILACVYGSMIGIWIRWLRKDPYIAFGPYLSGAALTLLLCRTEVFGLLDAYLELLRAP